MRQDNRIQGSTFDPPSHRGVIDAQLACHFTDGEQVHCWFVSVHLRVSFLS